MIVRPDIRTLEALSVLEHNREFKEIIGWLEASLGVTFERMMHTNGDVELRQQQGATQTLKEILDLAANARSLLKK